MSVIDIIAEIAKATAMMKMSAYECDRKRWAYKRECLRTKAELLGRPSPRHQRTLEWALDEQRR